RRMEVQTAAAVTEENILLAMNCLLIAIGNIGGPLIVRLYFLHGGKRIWFSGCLQTAGTTTGAKLFLMNLRVFSEAAAVGVLFGLSSYLYSYGMAKLPVSTAALLSAMQLVFMAVFAFLVVNQKFTAYSINTVVLLTAGAVVLGLHASSERPEGESDNEYWSGFVTMVTASALYGFSITLVELTYKKAKQGVTYNLVMESQLVMCFFATAFCIVGMLINNDFQREVYTQDARRHGGASVNRVPSRAWMYQRSRDGSDLLEFTNKIESFIDFVTSHPTFLDGKNMKCPCVKCKYRPYRNPFEYGFLLNYYTWTFHGEMSPVENLIDTYEPHTYHTMVMDAAGPEFVFDEMNGVEEAPNPKAQCFYDMLAAEDKELWSGYENHTLLSLVARLMALKSEHHFLERCFDQFISLLKEVVPKNNMVTSNFYSTKKLLCAERLACPHCMDETDAFTVACSGKQSWFNNHQEFFPDDHQFRKNRTAFMKNKTCWKEPPQGKSEVEILRKIEGLGLKKVTESNDNVAICKSTGLFVSELTARNPNISTSDIDKELDQAFPDWFANFAQDHSNNVNKLLVDLSQGRRYTGDDAFVLATQATQVFYCSYPSLNRSKSNWLAVCKINARSNVDVPSNEPPSNISPPFQDDEHLELRAPVIDVDDDPLPIHPAGGLVDIEETNLDESASDDKEIRLLKNLVIKS
ncbi:hypothetical protein C2S52_001019, partial [Perilla frutescens var. hirtella]